MTHVQQIHRIEVDEYLAFEQEGDVRHEYVDGVIYSMVGASTRHNLIAGTLFSLLSSHVSDDERHVFQSDMKVRTGEAFYYPDVMLTCGQIDMDAYYQDTPILIIEVLSDTTEAKDRLEKLVAYKKIKALQEYALVSQNKLQVEIYRRTMDGWDLLKHSERDSVHFKSVDLSIPIEEIYAKVINK